MTVSLKHAFNCAKSDGTDVTAVKPSNWNAEHTLTAVAGKMLGTPIGSTTVTELPVEVDSTLQSIKIPSGNTASRPATPGAGMLRFNTTTNRLEGYTDGAWKNIDNMSVSGTAPSAPLAGDLWIDTANGNTLKQYVGGAWAAAALQDGSVTAAKLASSVQQSLAPAGALMAYAGGSAPSGWLLCAGQAVSRTTYAALFAVLGGTYGTGDGSTTFNLPDLRGRVPAGKDNMNGTSADRLTNQSGGLDGDQLGATGGTETHVLTEGQMPAHNHSLTFQRGDMNLSGGGAPFQNVATTGYSVTGTTTTKGNNEAHNNVQPTIILNYIIKT